MFSWKVALNCKTQQHFKRQMLTFYAGGRTYSNPYYEACTTKKILVVQHCGMSWKRLS